MALIQYGLLLLAPPATLRLGVLPLRLDLDFEHFAKFLLFIIQGDGMYGRRTVPRPPSHRDELFVAAYAS